MRDRQLPMRWTAAVALAAATLLLTACRERSPQEGDSPGETTISDVQRWYGVYMQGAKIGHASIRERTFEQGGETLVETTMSLEIAAARENAVLRQRIESTSVETPDGELRSFSTRGNQSASGTVTGDMLSIRSAIGGDRRMAWKREFGGPFAWRKILRSSPPEAKEMRSFQAIDESFLAVVTHELIGGESAATTTPSGAQELRRFEHRITTPDGQMLSEQLWIDADGQCLKLLDETTGWELHLLPREAALAPGERQINLLYDTMVRLAAPIRDARTTEWARYRISVARGDPQSLVAACPSQAVRRVDDRTVEVVVRAVRPAGELAAETGAATFPAESQPADASCLEANHFISASDPRVVAMAAEVAAAESDPWTIAVTLERHVRQRMKQVDYSQAFLTAAETAEQLTGDCSEHAVLLAAVLRARNIPSRVAVGLVYVDAAAALGYHTWTEAWIGGRWVGLDATLADGGIAADHIKVAATSLERGLADPAIVALAQLLGAQPKITVVETRRRGH